MRMNATVALTAALLLSSSAVRAAAQEAPKTENPAPSPSATAAPAAVEAAATAADTPAAAAPDAKAEKKGQARQRRGGMSRFAALNLSGEQLKQVNQIEKDYRAENKELFMAMSSLRTKVREARSKNDQAALARLEAEAEAKRAELSRAGAARDRKIEALLTPEQRREWMTMKSDREKARRSARREE